MAHKTFISYKYSEAQDLRDRIIDAMGDDAQYYKGETSESPDLTDTSTENIKKNLRDMMFGTSVTIVIISPNIKKSKWIDWEIEYCLKEETRKDRTSHLNGVVGVIMKIKGNYDWFKYRHTNDDGCMVTCYHNELVYDIINNNRCNQYPKVYSCDTCKCVDPLSGSYITYVEEDEFLSNIDKYINNSLNPSNSNIRDSIEKNAQWSVELSHILLELDSMRYLRYMSHKHMFDMVQKNLRVADDERQLQAIMQQVDKSLDNVNNVVELRHADDTKYILFFISIASLFGVLLQSEDVPIISLISYKFGIGIALVLELLTAVIIVIGLSSFGRATLQYFRRKRDEKRKMK